MFLLSDSIEGPGGKGHQRSVSLTNNKVIGDKQFNVKSIRRYESVGTETYKSKSEKVYG